ncbi:ABC transporter permease [Amphibacillus sediminis]|uniref:ABC transporter permease n=1 Tax=Amphibacillus sediminis TaxID=360185 RepID=UPI0008315CB9|nr:ABC transporter permease [Amphibacillus sediminis]
MHKFWIVLSQTYTSRFKSKSFIITTLLFIAFVILAGNLDRIINLFANDDVENIAVIDETDQLYSMLEEQVEWSELDFALEDYQGTLEQAEEAVLAGEFVGVLHLQSDDELFLAEYYTDQLLNQSYQAQLTNFLQQIKVVMATNEAGIDPAVIESIYEPVSFETVAIELPDGTTARSEEEIGVTRGLVYVMLFVLYFAVINYGNMIAMDIANEKSSRVMEILISSSAPISQMFAKIIGIALLGLTQILIFIVAAYYMIQSRQSDFVGEFFEVFGFSDISISTYVYAVVFFLLGYLLYATLFAMLGSLVSRVEDVGQLMTPIILLIVAAFMISMFGINLPESGFVTITSYIPFFTPLVMFLRIGLLDIPIWEVALSIAILVGSIIILGVIGARVYRGGVLMYGRGVSLKDFKRALQLSKKDQ